MAFDSEFLRDTDKPALLAMDPPELLEKTRVIVAGLGYKVHVVRDHEEFNNRFGAVHYQLLILTDTFDSSAGPVSPSLQRLQQMPMALRRHTTVLLLGDEFQTLSPMQAFQHSVHAVVSRQELALLGTETLGPIVQRAVADGEGFLRVHRDIQQRIAQGRT